MKIRRLTDTGEWTTRRYLSLLGNVLIWIIVAIDAWYLWPTQLGGDTSIVVVSGESMEPTYFGGDLVIARKMEPSIGDVIVYAPEALDGSQIVHRIIGGSAEDGWQMQGDNNDFVDPFTPQGDEVKGVVLVQYPNFGRVTVLLLNPMVWAFVLLAAMVLMLWWSGDDCDDDDEDDAGKKRDDAGTTDSAAQDEPDLIDRVVEGAETAVSRMVDAAASAGAAVLALVTRPSPAPRHAGPPRRVGAPAYLRGSAIVGLLALLAVVGPSTASASQLNVTTSGAVSSEVLNPCANLALAAAPATQANGNQYAAVRVDGLDSACSGSTLTVYLHKRNGNLIETATGVVGATSTTVNTAGNYNTKQVAAVVVKINGWLFPATWSQGTPPAPDPFECDGILMSDGQVVTGTDCTLSGTVQYQWLDAYNGGPAFYGTVSANTAFSPGGYQSGSGWVNYQNITLWRYTVDLTTMGGSYYLGNLYNGFYLYKNGNNTALAPDEDCSDPASVTFQEAVASANPSSSFIVSPRPIRWMSSANLLCQGP